MTVGRMSSSLIVGTTLKKPAKLAGFFLFSIYGIFGTGGNKKDRSLRSFSNLVPGVGLEPTRLAAGDFESPASTSFATRAAAKRAL